MKPLEIPKTARPLATLFPKTDGLTIGDVIDDRHPALAGRICVHRAGDDAPHWLSTLRGICARTDDRVVTGFVEGCDDPIVIGVVDGYRERIAAPGGVASLELRPDETIRICAKDGTLLLAVSAGEGGPVLRLGGGDVCLQAEGHLRLEGKSVAISATRNNVDICAAADVDIQGETIQLN